MVSKRFLVIAGFLALAVAMGGFAWMQRPPADFDPSTYKNHNERLEQVAEEVPEFGGLFMSNNGATLNIYLTENETDQQKRERIQEKIEELFDVKSGLTLNVIKGDYTITQLSAWYDLIGSEGIWDQNGVRSTDLNEATNKIYVGVSSEEDVAGVNAFLDANSIPRRAVTVVVEEPMTTGSHTVRQRAQDDKMAGGYQIRIDSRNCTMGFVAIKGRTAGMVTAGHCTEAAPYDGGVTSGNQVHQPASYNLIGNEDIDPAFSTSLSGCLDSDGCRRSDSAFVDFSSGVQYNRGWIAKPSSNWGITVDPDTAHYSIVADNAFAVAGDQVIKVGRSTGRTTGDVTHTCLNEDDPSNSDWIGTFLCQTRVGISANPGDSGSPVFEVHSGDQVKLLGILILRSSSS